MKKMNAGIVVGVALSAALTGAAHGQWAYNTAGATIVENFNSMTSTLAINQPWVNDSTLDNWWQTGADYDIEIGTGNSGDLKNYGAGGNSDRALGSLASGSYAGPFGVQIVNNTGTTLTEFTLSYLGEQWRNGGSAVANTLDFSFLVTSIAAGTELTAAGYVDENALDFTSIHVGTPAASLDGYNAVNQLAKGPVTVTGISWAPGTYLWLRWNDIDNTGSDDGLAIDDLNFSAAVPAPGALALLGIAGLVGSRRRRVG